MVSGVSIKFLHIELAICRDMGTWNMVYIIPPDMRVIGLSFSKDMTCVAQYQIIYLNAGKRLALR